MITTEHVLIEIKNLTPSDLDRWIASNLIRPETSHGTRRFHDIDLARLRLIILLRDDFEIAEPALPTVLSLLDQLYDLRRQLRRLNDAVEHTIPPDIRSALLQHLEA